MEIAFEKVDLLCREAIAQGVTPGLVVLAVDGGVPRLRGSWGAAQVLPSFRPASFETIYDIASLTKAVATSLLAMQAVARGTLDLDLSVAGYLPEFADGSSERGAISVRQLLAHSAGLPAHRKFHEDAAAIPGAGESSDLAPAVRAYIENAAAREPLVYRPGTRSLYTDVGFIILGSLLERVGNARLDVQFDENIRRPLGLRVSGFVDLAEVGHGARDRLLAEGSVAATEDCPVRRRILVAEVHDLNAYAMGGIAGHAGLFSTAGDLGIIAEALALDWQGHERPRLVPRDLLREFWRTAGVPGSTWRLGWDGPAAHGSQAGEKLSRDAVGHLGFTGCSLWIDPERARWIVVLSNRIHPTIPEDARFRALRPAIHDALDEAFSSPGRSAARPFEGIRR